MFSAEYARSTDPEARKCAACDSLRISPTRSAVSCSVRSRYLMPTSSPSRRMSGGLPTVKWISEPPCCLPTSRNASIRGIANRPGSRRLAEPFEVEEHLQRARRALIGILRQHAHDVIAERLGYRGDPGQRLRLPV